MASINQLRQGLDILAKYCDPDCNDCYAEHDIVYSSILVDTKISEDDQKALDSLGWHVDEESGRWSRFT